MTGLSTLPVVLCVLCAGSGMFSLLIPQKRTKRILRFILGLFLLSTILSAFLNAADSIDLSLNINEEQYSDNRYDEEYISAIARQTAENLISLSDELLKAEGIEAEDIRLSVKISDDNRIYIDRVDIYINESIEDRTADIESIIYRNLAKEPDVYVNRQAYE